MMRRSLIASTVGLLMHATAADAASLTVVHSFSGGSDGGMPAIGLVSDRGSLYGITIDAGGAGADIGATIFKVDKNHIGKKGITTEYTFGSGKYGNDYKASLLVDKSGLIYGNAAAGGLKQPGCPSAGCGYIFSFDPTSKAFSIVYSFQGGKDGGVPVTLVFGPHDTIYGVKQIVRGSKTHQSIFTYNLKRNQERSVVTAPTGSYIVALAFDGANGIYAVSDEGGLSGCNSGCGGLLQLNIAKKTISYVHEFSGGADGGAPYSNIVISNGVVFGTTATGGDVSVNCFADNEPGCGTIFSFNPVSNVFATVYDFESGSDSATPVSLSLGPSGTLYGTTGGYSDLGIVFSYLPSSGQLTPIYNFTGPPSVLSASGAPYADSDGNIWGTSRYGGSGGPDCLEGATGCGTVYKIAP